MSLRPSILFCPDASERMRAELANLGISCESASEQEQAQEVDLIIFDARALRRDVAVLRQGFEDSHPGVPVVVMGDAGLESAILAMRAGAADYVEASAEAGEVAAIARRLISDRAIVSSLSGSSRVSERGSDLLGESPKIRELRQRVAALALDVHFERERRQECVLAKFVSDPAAYGPTCMICTLKPSS